MNLFKKVIISCLAIGIVNVGLLPAAEREPIPLQATLSTATPTHKLFEPGDKDAPHPFYKEECKDMAPPRPYHRATGSVTLLFDPNTDELRYAIAYSGLSGPPLMMHFHRDPPGQGGPIVQTIVGEPKAHVKGLGWSAGPPTSGDNAPTGTSGFITGTYTLKGNPHLDPPLTKEAEIMGLLSGDIYINIHTCLNELGELRGQIVPLAADVSDK